MTDNETKPVPVKCPGCGTSDMVRFVEIKRIERLYPDVEIQEDEYEGQKFRNLLMSKAEEEEVIDSMGNDEFFRCLACGHQWSVPEFDDVVVVSE